MVSYRARHSRIKPEPSNGTQSFLGMRADMNADVPPSDGSHSRIEGDDTLWAFLPILIGLAALCLLVFFFLSPSFEPADRVSARSARPGAAMPVTVHEDSKGGRSQ
jgi:hypothetical protein